MALIPMSARMFKTYDTILELEALPGIATVCRIPQQQQRCVADGGSQKRRRSGLGA
jgi:hypothetical protein